jgi:hypothetical protein
MGEVLASLAAVLTRVISTEDGALPPQWKAPCISPLPLPVLKSAIIGDDRRLSVVDLFS